MYGDKAGYRKLCRMRKKQVWQIVGCVALGLVAASLLGGYWYIQHRNVSDLQQQIAQLPDGKDKVTLLKDRVTLDNATYGNLVQAVGGLFLFITAFISFQNLKATQEKQVTERFTQAINQLGTEEHKKIAVRLGGIYALERIARDSEKDHWTIMEVLVAFVREKVPLQKAEGEEEYQKYLSTLITSGEIPEITPIVRIPITKIPKDVEAALVVIGRRESGRSELERINLSALDLTDAHLNRANLSGANLSGASLIRAHLNEANLSDANLDGADLGEAGMMKANLSGACLYDAILIGAYLSEANLSGSDLDGAHLEEVPLGGADLRNANLGRISKVQSSRMQILKEQISDMQKVYAHPKSEWLKTGKKLTTDEISENN